MTRKKAFVIGLGLIGGSLAKTLMMKQDVVVTGYDVHEKTVHDAIKLGVIHRGEASIAEGAKDADLILLAAPVRGILLTLEELAAVPMKTDAIVTDVGSAKRLITEKARMTIANKAMFIGGHPMAGSHKSGVWAASGDLFENAFYFLTPEPDTPVEHIKALKDWLSGTRAKVLELDPIAHDRIVGVISHFPHLVAAGLVHHLKAFPDGGFNVSRLAAGGFRDITRIASSDPALWQDIVSNNRDVLLALFDSWDEVMQGIKERLKMDDQTGIWQFFNEAKTFRDGFPAKQKGAIPASNDLYLDMPDRPGEISRVTGIIGQAGINIINLNVIELRENVAGVLMISFQKPEDRDLALALLSENGYTTYLSD